MRNHGYANLESLIRLQFKVRELSWKSRQPVHSLLSGRHASRLRGRGLTFEELRRYRPGDDIRSIDWRATARLRAAHVRVYSEERDRPVLLVVDQRASMFFGSARTTKATAAVEAAALAAWRAIDRGDRVGAIIFNDHRVLEIRPQRSRANVLRICHELIDFNQLLSANAEGGAENVLNKALRRAINVAQHDHLVLLLTDYDQDDDVTCERATRLAAHNDVLAILIYDPLGAQIPVAGKMEVTDGRHRFQVPDDVAFAERFEEEFRARCNQLRERLRAIRIPILPICTHEPIPEQVIAALGRQA